MAAPKGPTPPDPPVVKYWEDVYNPRYPSSGPRHEPIFSPINHEYLYKSLDKMPIKVCGETTGVDGSEFMNCVERPSYKTPFHEMVTIVRKNIRNDSSYISLSLPLG